ncbi:MAG: hypothetical protein KDH08_14090, partial [Anaerolineae bacterium]|nr:hypothetical protein [Anaerolineae bacterium]
MKTLRGRFILSHILPILLVVPLVALATLYLLETQVLLTTVSSNLEQQAKTIATAVTGNPDVLRDPKLAEQFLARISLQADRSLVLYDSGGNVVTASGQQDSTAAPASIASEAQALAQSGQPKVSMTYGLLRQTAEVLVPVT